jgi:hypothetical protein
MSASVSRRISHHHVPIVVLVSGWAGAGKDCAAALLVEECGFQRVAFADALKEDVVKVTGLPLEWFYSAQKDRPLERPCAAYPNAKTPRDILLQHALVRRAVDPDVYSKGVAATIMEAPGVRFVVSDWRYQREHEVLAAELGEFYNIFRIRIERPDVVQSADPSEHDLDGVAMEHVIRNDGTISDLRHAVKHFYHLALASAEAHKGDAAHGT